MRSLSTIPRSTSLFKSDTLNKLNISIVGTNNSNNIVTLCQCPDDHMLLLGNLNRSSFISFNEDLHDTLTPEQLSLCYYIREVVVNETVTIGTDESKTDSLVLFIMYTLRMHVFPLSLHVHPLYRMEWNNKYINSIPKFSVARCGKVLLIDEDKHIKNINAKKAWGEYQIAGSMIAVACNNLDTAKEYIESEKVLCMRVIGTRFSFYKAVVTSTYNLSISEGDPKEAVEILRYPEKVNGGLDFCDPVQRKEIVGLLLSLRKDMLDE